MSHPSPLEQLHLQADPLVGQYGTPERPISVVQAFDPIEVEYAAIRRHAAIIDQPSRGFVTVSGTDRIELLNRMLTQELKSLSPFESRSSFLLNRKGRIDGDLRVVSLGDRILLGIDVFAAERTLSELHKYVISESVALGDATQIYHSLSIHGPAAAAIVARASSPVAGASVAGIAPGQVSVVRIAGADITVDRRDTTGEIGLELTIWPAERASAVYEAISTPWSARAPHDAAAPQTDLARRIGWHAYNIARIEAGTPLYLLDFGPDSLPHETGEATLNDRVSFKKGCYLGQEIVARMQSLGHPKQKLVGLRMPTGAGEHAQAETGSPVLDTDQPGAAVIGAVTSSTFSPMNHSAPICFAMVKYSHAVAGKTLFVQTTTAPLAAVVQPELAFLKRA